MSEPKVGDMVRIVEEPWNQHAGDCVILERYNSESNSFDFVIPEQWGSVPRRMIDKIVCADIWQFGRSSEKKGEGEKNG